MARIRAKDFDLAAARNLMGCEWLSTAALTGVKLPLNSVKNTLLMNRMGRDMFAKQVLDALRVF